MLTIQEKYHTILDMKNLTHYIVTKDREDAKKLRVAHFGSEETVQFKGQYLNGLSKYRADKFVAMLEQRRKDAINRLADAITEYRETNPEPNESYRTLLHLSSRYSIGVKTLQAAVLMMAGGINAGATNAKS